MPVTNDTVVELKVTIAQLNVLFNALGELPFRLSNELIINIRNQVERQVQEMQSDNVRQMHN